MASYVEMLVAHIITIPSHGAGKKTQNTLDLHDLRRHARMSVQFDLRTNLLANESTASRSGTTGAQVGMSHRWSKYLQQLHDTCTKGIYVIPIQNIPTRTYLVKILALRPENGVEAQ